MRHYCLRFSWDSVERLRVANAAVSISPAAYVATLAFKGARREKPPGRTPRAFFLSAFAALGDPASRAYYDKKIAQGKHHTHSASPDAGPTTCLRCSATEPSTDLGLPQRRETC